MSSDFSQFLGLLQDSPKVLIIDHQPTCEAIARIAGASDLRPPAGHRVAWLTVETPTHHLLLVRFVETVDDGWLLLTWNKRFWTADRALAEQARFLVSAGANAQASTDGHLN